MVWPTQSEFMLNMMSQVCCSSQEKTPTWMFDATLSLQLICITFFTLAGRVPLPPQNSASKITKKIPCGSSHVDPSRNWQAKTTELGWLPRTTELGWLGDQAQRNTSHTQIEFKWFPGIVGRYLLLSLYRRGSLLPYSRMLCGLHENWTECGTCYKIGVL
jgi:hypothetical protein